MWISTPQPVDPRLFPSKAKAKQYKTELISVITALGAGEADVAEACFRKALSSIGATQQQIDVMTKSKFGLLG